MKKLILVLCLALLVAQAFSQPMRRRFATGGGSSATVTFQYGNTGMFSSPSTLWRIPVGVPSVSNGYGIVSFERTNAGTTDSVKLENSGQKYSLIGTISNDGITEYWGLVGPTSGSDTILVYRSASTAGSVTASFYYNVNQSTPYGIFYTNTSASGTSISLSVPSVTRGLVVATCGSASAPTNWAVTGTGGTLRLSVNSNTDGEEIASGDWTATGSTVVAGFSWTGTVASQIAGFCLQPLP